MNSVKIKLFKCSLQQFHNSKNYNNQIQQHKSISTITLIIHSLLQSLVNTLLT